MKKIILFSLLSIILFVSCAESKAVVQSEKLMRGDWTITQVTVDGINQSYVNAKVFDQADYNCYIGSQWHLVQNNNSGNYTLNGSGDCPAETTNIKWFVTEKNGVTEFMFKKVYQGEKPKNVADGYSMRVISNTGNSIIMKQDLLFEGKPIGINYTFVKN